MYIIVIYMELWTECTGFNWDEGNVNKNWEKHGVAGDSALRCHPPQLSR